MVLIGIVNVKPEHRKRFAAVCIILLEYVALSTHCVANFGSGAVDLCSRRLILCLLTRGGIAPASDDRTDLVRTTIAQG